jgi:hypothetical protein
VSKKCDVRNNQNPAAAIFLGKLLSKTDGMSVERMEGRRGRKRITLFLLMLIALRPSRCSIRGIQPLIEEMLNRYLGYDHGIKVRANKLGWNDDGSWKLIRRDTR